MESIRTSCDVEVQGDGQGSSSQARGQCCIGKRVARCAEESVQLVWGMLCWGIPCSAQWVPSHPQLQPLAL